MATATRISRTPFAVTKLLSKGRIAERYRLSGAGPYRYALVAQRRGILLGCTVVLASKAGDAHRYIAAMGLNDALHCEGIVLA